MSYSEQYTESRQQSVRMTVNRSWNDSTSATRAESLNEGISVEAPQEPWELGLEGETTQVVLV